MSNRLRHGKRFRGPTEEKEGIVDAKESGPSTAPDAQSLDQSALYWLHRADERLDAGEDWTMEASRAVELHNEARRKRTYTKRK